MNTKQLYSQFCRACYFSTGGWIPMTPLHAKLNLGDFGQIRQGHFKPLGNITHLRLVHAVKTTAGIALNPMDWQLERDAELIATSSQTDHPEGQGLWTTQGFVITQKGGFVFHGGEPAARFVVNWSEFCPDITLKLTQADYSFREICVVTAIASLNQWGLAIAGQDGAHLEVATQLDKADYGLLGHVNSRVLQSRHIACLEKANGRPAYFFKAKKLVLSDKKRDELADRLFQQTDTLRPDEFANWSSSELINIVRLNELNPNTCLEYFDWAELTLEDIEKTC